jgi:hypothetical protein
MVQNRLGFCATDLHISGQFLLAVFLGLLIPDGRGFF